MAALPATSENKYYYRESKLITSQSDSDSDPYDLPPDVDSDSTDSADSAPVVSPRSSASDIKSFADDSLPNNSLSTQRACPPARSNNPTGNSKSCDRHSKHAAAVLHPASQKPEIPKHGQTRTTDGRVNLAKVL